MPVWNYSVNVINKFVFLLCVADIYSMNGLFEKDKQDKKGIAIANVFRKILDESNRKDNKTWIDKGSEFTINQ